MRQRQVCHSDATTRDAFCYDSLCRRIAGGPSILRETSA